MKKYIQGPTGGKKKMIANQKYPIPRWMASINIQIVNALCA